MYCIRAVETSPVTIRRLDGAGGGAGQTAGSEDPVCGSALSTDSVGVVAHAPAPAQLQLTHDEQVGLFALHRCSTHSISAHTTHNNGI